MEGANSKMVTRRSVRRFGLFLSFLLGGVGLCSATNITYYVNETIGAGGVTSNIVTDGTIGVLGPDIIDWDLLLNTGTTTVNLTGPLSGANSAFLDRGFCGDLTATATQLAYNFGDNSCNPGNFSYFVTSSFPQYIWCLQGEPNSCAVGPGGGEFLAVGATSVQSKSLSGTQVFATTTPNIPEPSTFALLGMGFALLGVMKLLFRGLTRTLT
jgi:hypothetical protein